MVRGIIFEEQNNTSKNWGSIFKAAFPADGIISGCSVTFTSNSLVVGSGYFVAGGRVLHNDGSEAIPIATSLQNGYVRLIYRIDLNRPASATSFDQGEWAVDFSATPTFTSPRQEDINNTGKVYEVEFSVHGITGGSIAFCERTMRPAGNTEINMYSAGTSGFFMRRLGNYVGLYNKPDGKPDFCVMKLYDDGKIESFGNCDAAGNLNIGCNIIQKPNGRADFGKLVTINGADATRRLDVGWTGDGSGEAVEFRILKEDGTMFTAVEINRAGSVNIPVPTPTFEDDLELDGSLILKGKGQGVFSEGSGSRKALVTSDSSNKIWLGSNEQATASEEVAVSAYGSVSIMTFAPGGYKDALVVDSEKISATRNMEVGDNNSKNTLRVKGMIYADGGIQLTGAMGMSSLELAENLKVGKDTTLIGLLNIDGKATMKSGADVYGDLNIKQSLDGLGSIKLPATGHGIYADTKQLVYFNNGIMALGSTDTAQAPMTVQIAPSSSIELRGPATSIYGSLRQTDYTKNAVFGCEMAITGQSTRRFSVKFVDGGNSGEVAMVLGQGEGTGVMRIDTSGNLTVQKILKVPSRAEIGAVSAESVYSTGNITAKGNLATTDGYIQSGGNIHSAGSISAKIGISTSGYFTANGICTVGTMLELSGDANIKKQANAIRLLSTGVHIKDAADRNYVAIAAAEFKQNSSRLAKRNIQKYTGALDALRGMEVFEYDRIVDGSHQVGLIVEDAGCPDVVKSSIGTGDKQQQFVDMYSFTSVTAAAVKELEAKYQTEMRAVLKRIDELEKTIN